LQPLTRAAITKQMPSRYALNPDVEDWDLGLLQTAFGKQLVELSAEIARQMIGTPMFVVMGQDYWDKLEGVFSKPARMKCVHKMTILEEDPVTDEFSVRVRYHGAVEDEEYEVQGDNGFLSTGSGSDPIYVYLKK
jgi:hypothetical protein